jgi:hypothetical protein
MVPPTTAPGDLSSYKAALYSYDLAARLFRDARAQFADHIARYKNFAQVYFVHVDDAINGEQLMRGDHDYLAAMTATGAQRGRLLQSAYQAYDNAMRHCALTVMKYYVDDQVAAATFPLDPMTGRPRNRATIEFADPNTYMQIFQNAMAANDRFVLDPETHQYSLSRDIYHDDRETYVTYISRCQTRMRMIQSVTTQPTIKSGS